jgi:hypothetical protein
MVKRIISAAGAVAILAAFPAAAFAQTPILDNISVKPTPVPVPIYHPFEVTPGNPLHLQGCGGLKAEGKGLVYFRDVRGQINVSGKGILAVERGDLSKVTIDGFKQKMPIGRWIIFIGEGAAKASGADLDLAFHGKAAVYARGCGEATFKGYWKGVYWQLIHIWPVPIPAGPIELEAIPLDTN